jgi:transcription termination/antitermination protein NusA
VKLTDVVNQLVEERGLDKNLLNTIICEGMLAAYNKKFPELELKAEYDKKTGEIEVKVKKEVVASVEDEDTQISLRKAKNIDPAIEISNDLWVPFEGKIGRIEILKAKQVIADKIRLIEAEIVYKAFKDKEGSIILGSVNRCERSGALVKIQDTLAFLPTSLMIPGDKCIVGYPIRALLKEVLLEPRNESQLILDRKSPEFLKGLFELEIPEVFEKLVEVKKIVRSPGYKSKVAVITNDPNIDPVGTCIGIGGARIKPILKEINGERIDIIHWSDSLESLIKDSLKPAQIDRVELIDKKSAKVWLDEDQRSVAIGKMGQNIALASQLTGVDIQLVEKSDSKKQNEEVEFEID